MDVNDITFLGDPHLGKRFVTGVPLHRRGEREESQWKDFERSIWTCTTPVHVCMGDIFDKFIVPPEVVIRVATIYMEASKDVEYFIILGNHDASRDQSRGSSFDLLQAILTPIKNVTLIRSAEGFEKDGIGFVPYDIFSTAEEMIRSLPDGLDMIFTHLDYTDFGGDHVLPTKLLAEKGIKLVINGHDHIARTEKRHGVEVRMVGSMQPYTHAEDPEGHLYVTRRLDDLDDVKDKNVRLILAPGEEAPTDLDCLSLQIVRETEDSPEIDTSDFDALDLRGMLKQVLDGSPLQEEMLDAFDTQD